MFRQIAVSEEPPNIKKQRIATQEINHTLWNAIQSRDLQLFENLLPELSILSSKTILPILEKIVFYIMQDEEGAFGYFTNLFKQITSSAGLFSEALEILLTTFINTEETFYWQERIWESTLMVKNRIFPIATWLILNNATVSQKLIRGLRMNVQILVWISRTHSIEDEVLFSNLEIFFHFITILEKNGNTALHYVAEYGAPPFVLEWAMQAKF